MQENSARLSQKFRIFVYFAAFFGIHQILSICQLVLYKDRKAVCAVLKKIYGAVNHDDA